MTGGKSTPKIIQLIRQAQGLDPEEESILKKLTPHVPGVVTFADHNKPLPWTTEYRSVLVFADISGFTALCECYASMEKSGIDQLTKNLNDYLGAMVDLILKADGDVLKFAGDAILSLWRVNTPKDLLSVVEKVIRCCLNIQKNCGEWKTDIGVILTVKLGVSMGNTRVTFLGNDTFRMYVERGQPVTDVNIAESFCKSGYIVLSPYTWEICRKPRFTFEVLEDGQHVRVLSMKEDVQPVMPTIEITADEEENDDETANTPTNYLTRFKARRLSLESSANVKIMAKRFHSMAKRTSSAVQPSPSYESDVGTTTANPSVMSVNPTSSLMVNTFTSSPSVDSATTPESTESRLTPALDTSTLSVPVPPTLTPVDVTDSKAHISKPTSPSSPVKKGLAGGKLAKLRNVAKQVAKLKLDQSLRLYVLSPVLKKLDDNQPLEYLSEMRKVSIVFMNLILNKDFDATSLLQQVFDTVYLQSSIMHGCLNKVFLFDKGCTFLVIFGLPGYKHERDCAHALMCSYKMRKTLVKMAGVMNVSIGVTTGTTFCGVVGHTNRHEYSVIGSKVNMAARLMMHYPDKVTCDDNTFQFSRLQANSFQVLITKRMKGLRSSGVIREYTETDAESATNLNSVIRFQYPLLGRNYEKNIFDRELCFLLEGEDNGSYKECQHLVFVGAAGIGKTRLLDHLIVMTEKTGTRVISCSLKLDNLFDANFLTTYVILILLNSAGFSYQVNKEPILMDHLNRAGYASSLHKLNDILSCNFQKTDSAEGIQAKEEDLLCCIASVCIEKLGGVVIALDDAHHIDPKSWLFILRLITVPGVIVVSTVRPLAVEAPPCPAASNFFDHKMVKLRDIAGLESKYMTALACQLMEVSRIPKELERMLREMTHGVPSWCEQLLVDMVEKKQLTILQDSGHFKHVESMVAPPTRYIRHLDTDDDTSNLDVRQCNEIFYKTSSINTLKSESGHSILADLGFLTGNTSFNHDDEKEEKKSKIERITVFSPGIEPNEIKVPDSMKELIMTRIDSMRASEQLIVKCAAVLGTSFSRDMLETILPKVQRVKARKCFRQLAFNGIFECANIPAARYNQMMQGRDDTISWDTCYCVKEENLYVQDLCNKMRFRNALIQQTAYETLMESQRRELHAKSAEYLEKQADKYRLKIPYYLLGRIPRNSETENTGSEIAVRRAGWKIRASIRVGDIGSYQQSRGRRFGFSLDIEKRDPLVQVLREQFSLNQTTDEMLECLLPTYKMILYHWKAAKRYQNLVNQILEASSAAVAISKAEQAMDLLVEVDAVLQSMENKDDVDCESLIILKSRANRLWSKTFKLVGQEEQCYSFLEKAARLVGLKQPTRIATAKLKLKVLKLGMFFAQNRDRPMLPASELVTEQCYCLLDLYYYHKENDNTQFMVLSAMLLMSKSCNRMPLLHHVVQGYYAVMEYYRSLSDRNMEMRLGLELIDRCLNRHKDLTKNDCVLLSRVYANLCILHLEAGNITQALTMGFSSINLAEKTSDDSFMKKTGHNLGFALILANKIDMCIDLLLKLRGGIPDRITSSWYYALCLELVQNGDPGPEHYISCLTFSASLFKSMDAVSGEHTSRYYLAMCMAIYYCRCQDWEACQRWFDYWELYRTTELSFFPLYTLCKEVEVKLLSISACRGKPHKVWKPMQASVRKDLDFLTRNLAILPGLKPRVFHLKSYYYALFCKTGKALRSLNRASKVAREQGNQSERRWTEHHRHVWFNAPKECRQWAKIPEENSNVWRWNPERGKLFTWPLG